MIGQPGGIPLDEAARLAAIIAADPSSQTCTALNGWTHPMSREALILADLFDLQHFSKVDPKKGKPKPYPRAWPTERDVEKFGDTGGRSPAEVIEILRAHGLVIKGEVAA